MIKWRCSTDHSLFLAWSGERSQGLVGDCRDFFGVTFVTHVTYDRIISWEISVNWWIHVTPPVFEGGWLEEECWEGKITDFFCVNPPTTSLVWDVKHRWINHQTCHVEKQTVKTARKATCENKRVSQDLCPQFSLFQLFFWGGYLWTTLRASFLRCVEKTRLSWFPWFTYVFPAPKVV